MSFQISPRTAGIVAAGCLIVHTAAAASLGGAVTGIGNTQDSDAVDGPGTGGSRHLMGVPEGAKNAASFWSGFPCWLVPFLVPACATNLALQE